MDTDGEIDVDDCDDREYHPPVGNIQIFRRNKVEKTQHI